MNDWETEKIQSLIVDMDERGRIEGETAAEALEILEERNAVAAFEYIRPHFD